MACAAPTRRARRCHCGDVAIEHDDPRPAGLTRKLGRSRRYQGSNLPVRLTNWHAPRANRWERLCVVAGELVTEWLDTAGVGKRRLVAGQSCWVEPGRRWRIAEVGDAAFELEIHADETVAAAEPLALRAALLDEAGVEHIASDAALRTRLLALDAGERIHLHTNFDCGESLRHAIMHADGDLFWHPLELHAERSRILLGRATQPLALADYLGRDHAIIEAALAGALRGKPGHLRWLRNLLARHLFIEEEILFPAYLAAGGNAGWVRGLRNEHDDLRRHLPQLDAAVARRRFLLLLDGHDEKEEQIVYPDIVDKLGPQLANLTRATLAQALAGEQV